MPQKEIARRLGISEKTVEKHIAKGCRMMANHFYAASRGDGTRTGDGSVTARKDSP
jgi:RNA polymerase sigma-70 factor (ECF subfamily)